MRITPTRSFPPLHQAVYSAPASNYVITPEIIRAVRNLPAAKAYQDYRPAQNLIAFLARHTDGAGLEITEKMMKRINADLFFGLRFLFTSYLADLELVWQTLANEGGLALNKCYGLTAWSPSIVREKLRSGELAQGHLLMGNYFIQKACFLDYVLKNTPHPSVVLAKLAGYGLKEGESLALLYEENKLWSQYHDNFFHFLSFVDFLGRRPKNYEVYNRELNTIADPLRQRLLHALASARGLGPLNELPDTIVVRRRPDPIMDGSEKLSITIDGKPWLSDLYPEECGALFHRLLNSIFSAMLKRHPKDFNLLRAPGCNAEPFVPPTEVL